MHAVRAPHHHGVLELERPVSQDAVQFRELFGDRLGCLLQQQCLGCVHNIVRGESVVQPAGMLGSAGFGHLLRYGREKSDDVVPHLGLDRLDAGHIEPGMLA